MAERVPVALVGLGDIGLSAHLPAILGRSDVALAALVDPAPERRQQARNLLVASGHDAVPTHTEVAEVLADERIPALVLATPPWVTTDLAATALSAGRHVLAEKPIATSVAAAGPLRSLPAGARARLQVGLTYRHDPALEALRDALAAGRLGGPLLVRAHIYDERRDPADPAHAERIAAALRHGTPVMHEGSHVFDWLAVLLGGPAEVRDAWALRTAPDAPAPNLTGARLAYPGGTVVLMEFGWWADRLPACELSILGDRGHAVLDCATFRLELSTADGTEVVDPPGERTARCFDRQLARFVELVSGRRAVPEPGLSDGLAALALSERVAELAEEHGPRRREVAR